VESRRVAFLRDTGKTSAGLKQGAAGAAGKILLNGWWSIQSPKTSALMEVCFVFAGAVVELERLQLRVWEKERARE
jgi:hypothetical protein